MAASRAAVRYAKATLGLALDKKVADKVEADMKTISETLAGSKELQSVLNSPIIKSSVKKASLSQIFKGLNGVTEGVIDVLLTNKRIDVLDEVALKYIILHEQLKGQDKAVVTTAVPLSGDLEQRILAKVKALTGKEVSIENKIDESILGGFVLRVGDLQYDASISNKLSTLKRSFTSDAHIAKI